MKLIISLVALAAFATACNKSPSTEYSEKQQEVNEEYTEKVNDAKAERAEEMEDVREDLRETQKEEAVDYVEESDSATIERDLNRVKVDESKDQIED